MVNKTHQRGASPANSSPERKRRVIAPFDCPHRFEPRADTWGCYFFRNLTIAALIPSLRYASIPVFIRVNTKPEVPLMGYNALIFEKKRFLQLFLPMSTEGIVLSHSIYDNSTNFRLV